MARTITEIQIEMDVAYKAAFGLTTEQMSNAGVWKLVRGIVALAIFTLETLFDNFKTEVTALAASVEFGNAKWWYAKMLAFQYGDPLIELNGQLYYATIDTTKQIIAKCSITDVDGVVKIKIAALSGSELVIISDAGKRAAIDSYVNEIKPAGIVTQIISNNADKLKFNINFVFDGKLVQADFETTVKAAIKSFLKDIEFDGQFKINKFRDALEAIPGMIEVYIEGIDYKDPDDTVWVPLLLNEYNNPVSGYYKHEEGESTLIFTPQ